MIFSKQSVAEDVTSWFRNINILHTCISVCGLFCGGVYADTYCICIYNNRLIWKFVYEKNYNYIEDPLYFLSQKSKHVYNIQTNSTFCTFIKFLKPIKTWC